MQLFTDHVQDQYGNAISGASVLISQDGSPATIYSDNGVTPKANPLTTGSNGEYSFYAAGGTYIPTVTTSAGSLVSHAVTLFDPEDLAAPTGSALVGFLQAGPGAVARTMQDKLRDTVSVRDFGAVGDGVTDDTAAIQAAFTYAATLGVKRVYFPAGIYKITSPIAITGSNWEIYGDGESASTILAGADGDMLQIDCRSSIYRYVTVRDLAFKRESATYSNTYAIHIRGTAGSSSSGLTNSVFRHLTFSGVEYGIYADDAGDYTTSGGSTINGGHSFLSFENLHVPLELNNRYPASVVRFVGAAGPHDRFFGGQYRADTAGIQIGSGAANQIQGDMLICGIHFLAVPVGTAPYCVKIVGGSNAFDGTLYTYNFSITSCQFDGSPTIANVHMENLGLLRLIGNNAGGVGNAIINCREYVIEDSMQWSFVSANNLKTFTINHPLTVSQAATFSGLRVTNNGWTNVGDSVAALTIAAGAVTATKSQITVDTESAAATDDLDTISGGGTGDTLIVRAASSARDVVCKDGTGNLRLAGDFTLTSVQDTLLLYRVGSDWFELSRSDNTV
jgi:hypothetical protein